MNINGHVPGAEAAAAALHDPIVEALRGALAAAQARQIDSIAILAVGPRGDITRFIHGGRRGDMHTGLSMLQLQLLTEMLNPQPASRIVPVRG